MTATTRTRRPLAAGVLAAAAGLVLAGALVHGRAVGRWGPTVDLDERAAALAAVPAAIGDWDGQDLAVDPGSLEVAGVNGHLSRRYRHRTTGEEVTVLLVSGRPGRVAAHPPEVCYAGVGYTAGPRRVREVGPGSTCWQADFVRPSDTLRVVWGWGGGDRWAASAVPRVEFAAAGNLYKLYAVRLATDPDRDERVLAAFLGAFLPECRQRLAPAAGV